MTDTVFVYLADTINQSDYELLSQVEQFYDRSWNKLIWFIGIGVAVVGIIMPLLINWLQRQSLKEERQSIRDETTRIIQFYENQINTLITQTRNDLNKRIDERVNTAKTDIEKFSGELKKSRKEFDEKIKHEFYMIQGMLFEFQAMKSFEDEEFDLCFDYSRVAIISYLGAKEYESVKQIIDLIVEDILPNLGKKELDKTLTKYNITIEKFISELKEFDKDNALTEKINKLEQALNDKLKEEESKT